MSGVWSVALSIRRALSIGTVLIALLVMLPASNARAQSSIGFQTGAATGRSLHDAASQNEKELLDREVLGGSAGSSGGTAAAAAVNVFPTGRLRSSEHDGLKPPSLTTFAFTTQEQSAFANFVITVPGTVFGGQLKISGFVGENWLSVKLKSNETAILDPNQFGTGKNESTLVGGTVLWSLKNTYALATVIGMWGETTLIDSVDDCFPGGCNVNRYKFDTTTFMGTVTAGHVFDLAAASGPKLDVRGSVSHIRNFADPFKNISTGAPGDPPNGGVEQTYMFSTWTGTGALTLFSNINLQNNSLLRPYVQGYVRQEWNYQNTIKATEPDGNFLGKFNQQQEHLYGGVDLGLTYTLDKMTAGAAIYFEGSGDERTRGARLGVSWKLN